MLHSAKILDAKKPVVFAAGRGIDYIVPDRASMGYGTDSGNPFTLLFRICTEVYRLFYKP